jgi:hypothetical protein
MSEIIPTKICKGILCKGTEKNITEFSPKSKICKKCVCHNTKEYYKKNNRPYRLKKNELKSEAKCVQCGCNDIRLLEFDHLDKKNFNICKNFSKESIVKEANLTQFLCVWCHRLKSREQMDEKKEQKSFEITDRPTNPNDGKPCVGDLCQGKLQYHTMFYNMKKKSYCKICYSYKGRLVRELNGNFVNNLKLQLKECELCKIAVTEETVCCFDFDHLRDKTVNVSILVRLNSNRTKQIEEEAKKCRLLCCKCHRIVTAEQFKFNYEVPQNPTPPIE